MSKRARDEAHGMSSRETAIMSLSEAGIGHAAIAEQLQVAQSYVEGVVNLYGFDTVLRSSVSFERKARAATKALEAAILATGKRFA